MSKTKFMMAALGTLLVGCGGSSGIGSGFPDSPHDNPLLPTGPGLDGGSVPRTYKAGDTWEFTVGGTMLREDYDATQKLVSKTSGPVTGTLIRQVSAVTFQGNPALKFTDALSYKINGGLNKVEILESYGIQQLNGSVTMVGRRDNNVDCGTASKAWLPSTYVAGSNVGGGAHFVGAVYANDFYETSTALSVTNSGSVTSTTAVPFTALRSVYADSYVHSWDAAARFQAGEFVGQGYRMKTVEEISSIDDWCPLWGSPIQRAYQSTRTDSIVDNITLSNGVITITYHIEKRSLDLKMVLKSHSLQ
jgi:hypothetical protein